MRKKKKSISQTMLGLASLGAVAVVRKLVMANQLQAATAGQPNGMSGEERIMDLTEIAIGAALGYAVKGKKGALIGAGSAALMSALGIDKALGLKGLGEIDTSSPEYAAWYQNEYLPYIQQQGRYSYDYGYQQGFPGTQTYPQSYATGAQQCAQRGGLWDSFSNQCQNPNQAQLPYNPYVQPQAQYPNYYPQQGYNQYPGYIPQGQPSYSFPTASPLSAIEQQTEQLIDKGLSAGLIYAVTQSKRACKINQSRYCNVTFASADSKKRMNYKVAANLVRVRLGTGGPTTPVPYSPGGAAPFQPVGQPATVTPLDDQSGGVFDFLGF